MSGRNGLSVHDRVLLLRRMAERAGSGPLLVRGLLFAVTAVAVGLAVPSTLLLGRGALLVLGGAFLVTVAPRGRLVSFVLLATATSWLLSTIAFDDRITAWRLVSLAGAMYLVHTLAALAAVLPYDAVVPPGAVAAWLVRASLVAAVSGALGVVALVEARRLVGPTYLAASVGGVAVVGLLVWLLARVARR